MNALDAVQYGVDNPFEARVICGRMKASLKRMGA
jgi:hypothetical protein